MSINILKYNSSMHREWDNFVASAKNSTFLHMRPYMDYHSDRFNDYSLVAMKGGKIAGLLPACREGSTIYSHKGLTYGGWIIKSAHFSQPDMLEIWDRMADLLHCDGISSLVYKPVPHIYHTYPAEEDLYAIFRHGGQIMETNISATVSRLNKVPFNENARRSIKFALGQGVTVKESTDFDSFWQILSELLHERYATSPVHTADEKTLLHSRFPGNIRLFTAMCGNRIIGGTVIFLTKMVAHAQYIAASPEAKEKKALPALFDYLINGVFADVPYFDFGISNEQHGRYLNEGLITQKYGMGGRGIVYNTYLITF